MIHELSWCVVASEEQHCTFLMSTLKNTYVCLCAHACGRSCRSEASELELCVVWCGCGEQAQYALPIPIVCTFATIFCQFRIPERLRVPQLKAEALRFEPKFLWL